MEGFRARPLGGRCFIDRDFDLFIGWNNLHYITGSLFLQVLSLRTLLTYTLLSAGGYLVLVGNIKASTVY